MTGVTKLEDCCVWSGGRISVMVALALCWWTPSGPVAAQTPPRPESDSARTAVIVPGAQYAAGGFKQFLFGSNYRDLWTTPLEVELLDLETFAGGLTPLRKHVGSQTRSLRFGAPNGTEYVFRLVDKEPEIPPELEETVVATVVQDAVSTTHPAAKLVAARLLQAAGVLRTEPRLFVLPDTPALGEFRSEFAGTLGVIEERSNEGEGAQAGFAGASQVIGSTRLFERLDASPNDRVDARAFLAARLMDVFMGDRDRHRDQWRWARFGKDSPVFWQPISRDHDHAFEKLSGFLLSVAKSYVPEIVVFGPEYTDIDRLHWYAREVDRRFLAELERPAWDSVATALQGRLTDQMIDEAVRGLPPELCALNCAELSGTLKRRRDGLHRAAARLYEILARQVEIHATNASEQAEITRVGDRYVDVVIASRGQLYFRRRFDSHETKEIRVAMWGGNDRVVVRGDGNPGITLRVIGGQGDDELVDSTGTGGLRLYDADTGAQEAAGRRTPIDTRPYQEWIGSDANRYPPRDWGNARFPLAWINGGPNVGVFLGAGFRRETYGFRKTPYASRIELRAGFATGPPTGRIAFDAEVRKENSSAYATFHAMASGLEVLHYYGLGNKTSAVGGSTFFKIKHQQYLMEATVVLPVGRSLAVSVGPVASFSHTGPNTGRYIGSVRDSLYGAEDFGQVGGRLGIRLDTRDRAGAPTKGVRLTVQGRVFPKVFDVKSAYGTVDGEAATYVTAPISTEPTLALRAGGKKVFGAFPFQESAFLGGVSTLRGFDRERFAGDAMVYASAELRLFLAKIRVVLPEDFGVFGFTDAGRVFVDGDSPGGWHTAGGGGVWFGLIDRANVISIGLARSTERTAVYIRAGFAL